MEGKDATIRLIEVLEAAHIGYMFVGSFSSNYHGIACATKDADIVVSASGSDLVQTLHHLSPELQMDRPARHTHTLGGNPSVAAAIKAMSRN